MKKTKRIEEFLNSIDWLFDLNNFDRSIKLEKTDPPDGALAMVVYVEEYREISIKIYPHFFDYSLATQRKCLLHELCHALTLPSKTAMHDLLDGKLITPEQIRRINETETSKLENILNGLLSGRIQYASRAYKKYLK